MRRSPRRSTGSSDLTPEIQVVGCNPAERPIGIIKREQDRADEHGLQQMPLEVELVRRAVCLARHLLPANFLGRFHPERQQGEGGEGEEQDIDRDDRGEFHAATCSSMTSTSGFLPVHSVAQRRTASRTASRVRSSSVPGLKARVAASVASAMKSSRSSSTGTPNGRTSGLPASWPSSPTGTATVIKPPKPIRRRSFTLRPSAAKTASP